VGSAPPVPLSRDAGGEEVREVPPGSRYGRLEWALFSLGLVVYLVTRLWGITRFPIYFFCDEANPSLLAEQVFSRGLRDQYGTLFPLYFEVAPRRWCPELQVYFHGLGSLLFGRSILVTRTTQVIVCVLAPIAVALALRLVFKARSWWAGPFLLALSPAWFLHSRTGFNPVVMATFYACFLLGYLLYRTRSPRFLFVAAVFGAATFYSYSNGQMVMAAAVFLLAVTDLPFHLRNRKVVLQALALAAVLAIPAIRFQDTSPNELGGQLRVVRSYWFTSQPVHQKAAQFARTWAHGLSPTYWFAETAEQVRHRMKGYGRLSRWLLPVFLVGVGVAGWHAFRGSAPHRILLLAAVATPAGAALAEVGITRLFAFLVPATLLIGVGLEALYSWTVRRLPENAVATVLSVGLTVPSFVMLRDSLENGPTWFDDYALYGMQYGARQVFGEMVPELLSDFPEATIGVSPNWANSTELFARFFLTRSQQSRVRMEWIGDFLEKRLPTPPGLILLMPADEYAKARSSGKFKEVNVERQIPYPDGRPGFYAVRLVYADDADRLIAQEHALRARPVIEEVVVRGETVTVTHSPFDIGSAENLFDGDAENLVRGLEANPLVLDFAFPTPRSVETLTATFGSMDFSLEVSVWNEGEEKPRVFSGSFRDLPLDPTVRMPLDGPHPRVSRLRLSIRQLGTGEPAHIHVREIDLR
jgi:hypothetical protein